MLQYVNAFRTGSEAYYNDVDGNRVYVKGLKNLVYDYALEEVAKQRAAEIVIKYSHTRPNGGGNIDLCKELGYSVTTIGENIDIRKNPSAEEEVDVFKEDGRSYGDQGHRRAMLKDTYVAFAAACAEYNGEYHWVQLFTTKTNSTKETHANNNDEWPASVQIQKQYIKGWQMENDPMTVRVGTSDKIRNYSHVMITYGTEDFKTAYDLSWTSDDTSVLETNGGNFTANKRGTAILLATAPDNQTMISFNVSVISAYTQDGKDAWTWSDDHKTASVRLVNVNTGETKTVKASVSEEVTKSPSCEYEGTSKFTAAATFEGETYTQTVTANTPAAGHKWGNPEYEWSGLGNDTAYCYAKIYCETNSSHRQEQTAYPSIEYVTAPTCTAKGKAKYTAVFTAPFRTQTKTVELPAYGHSVDPDIEVIYTWADDMYTCTAEGKCANCGKKVTETVIVEQKDFATATKDRTGWRDFVARFKTPGFEKQARSFSTPKLTDPVTMYRLYNPNSGEHFYTAKAKERDYLKQNGWKYEGVGWKAPGSSIAPVYRLYNTNSGDHHYTMKIREKNALVKLGWKYEGIGWYSDEKHTVPLYREYNPNAYSCNHNYTTNKKEHDALVKNLGWKDEGIGWYGIK
nr:hypothetical protein [Solobacterium sp.]